MIGSASSRNVERVAAANGTVADRLERIGVHFLAAPWVATAVRIAYFCTCQWAHNEQCVTGRVEQLERPRAPLLIFRRSQDVHLGVPLLVIAIRIIDLERHTSISAVAAPRAIEGYLDRSTRYPKQSGMAVFGRFEGYTEA